MTVLIRSFRKPTCRRAVLVLVTALSFLAAAGDWLEPGLAAAQERSQAERAKEESWQVIYFDAQRIGYSRTLTEPFARDGQELLRTHSETHMVIKRFGQSIKSSSKLQTEETTDGNLLNYSFEMTNPSIRTTGRIDGDELHVETRVAGRSDKTRKPWDKDVKSPNYEERVLRDPPLQPGEKRSFKMFSPDSNEVKTIHVAADEVRATKLFDGKTRELLKVRISPPAPFPAINAFVDETGDSLKSVTNLLGFEVTTYSVTKEVALQEIVGEELDIAVKTLVKVDPIQNAHRTRQIVYRITIPGDDPTNFLVAGETQSVKKVDAGAVELTVTAIAPPEFPRTSVRTEPEFSAPTRYLQTADRRVVEHAERAAGSESNSTRIALKMERYVQDKLTKKNFSTAMDSAAEVAEKLEGDCTEHAVLLAAMLRVKKIPSRIAVGLVYIQGQACFGGHMWTEAFLDGTWIPFDATLGQGGIGAGHIKLAHSSFADDAPAPVNTFVPLLSAIGSMQIQVLKVDSGL